MKINREWLPERPKDFLFALAALAVLIAAFFLAGGTNLFYHFDPFVIILCFLGFGVLYALFDAYFGSLWHR